MDTSDVGKWSHLGLYSVVRLLPRGIAIAPVMAILHLTNRCNHLCQGCEYADLHHKDVAEFDQHRLLTLIDEIAELGSGSVLITGGGEPTLHPAFAEALERMHAQGLLAGLFTNGTRIDDALAAVLVRCACFVRVSVDAATAESYAALRGVPPSALDLALSGVKRLLEARRASGSKLEIGLKFLVRQSNIAEIGPFVALAESLGVDNVHFKPLRGGPAEPADEQSKQAQQLIDEARIRHPGMKIAGHMPPHQITVQNPCWISPLRVVISAEGDVHLCNYFHHRRQTHCYGNIYQASLRDIWFSEAHRKALASIKTCECERFDCRFHKLNVQLRELVENCRPQLEFV